MKNVRGIYTEYRIMPSLQMHQFRVAAVAKIIIDNFKGAIDKDAIIFACIFHDMGNIIKSDLNYFPEFLKPQGMEYWKKVKDEYVEKYGSDEHLATELIAKEIGILPNSIECIRNIGFSKSIKNSQENSFENKICNYADMRVGPYGVVSINDRMTEGRKRYAGRKHSIVTDFDSHSLALQDIEKQIFEKIDIKPQDINDEVIESVIEELKNIEI